MIFHDDEASFRVRRQAELDLRYGSKIVCSPGTRRLICWVFLFIMPFALFFLATVIIALATAAFGAEAPHGISETCAEQAGIVDDIAQAHRNNHYHHGTGRWRSDIWSITEAWGMSMSPRPWRSLSAEDKLTLVRLAAFAFNYLDENGERADASSGFLERCAKFGPVAADSDDYGY